MSTMWKQLYNRIAQRFKKRNVMWVEVPNSCRTLKDKKAIILATKKFLEQSIKIN